MAHLSEAEVWTDRHDCISSRHLYVFFFLSSELDLFLNFLFFSLQKTDGNFGQANVGGSFWVSQRICF